MATRPIITVDVADSAFQRFVSLFNEYTTKLGEQPEVWAKINEAMGGAGKSLESGAMSGKEALALAAAQAGVVAEALSEATKAQNEFGRSVNRSGKGMESLAKSAKGVGSAISAVAGGILKIAAGLGLGALLGGLGIGDLTDAAFSRIRSAGQLGVRTGQLSSFQVNAQQFLTTSALSAAANAKNDPGSISQFGALGISNGERLNLSTPALAFLMAQKAAAAYRTNPGGATYLPAIRAYQNLGGSLGDVRNVAMHPRAFALAQENYRADIASLNISREEGQAWVQLKLKMDLAGQTIQTALINKLGPLVPEITKLTVAVIGAVTSFMGGKNFDTVVLDAKLGIGQLAKFVLKTNWEQLGKNISKVSDDIGAVAKVLGYIWNPETTPGSNRVNKAIRSLPTPDAAFGALRHLLGSIAGKYASGEVAVLGAITGQESGGSARAVNPDSGASGRYQFMPGTAATYLPAWWRKKYGDTILGKGAAPWLADKANIQESVAVGYYKMLDAHAFKLSHKHGNAALIAAGWYGGIGGMDALWNKDPSAYASQGKYPSIAAYAASVVERERRSRRVAPSEPQAHPVPKPVGRPRKVGYAPVHVTITNHTAARVDVSANAAAFG